MHGHSFEAVKGYTISQVQAFLGAAERHQREKRLGDAIALRMANADKKGWKAYIKKLEG